MYPETILPIVAHIPHSGTVVPEPFLNQFLQGPEQRWQDIIQVTDWYTHELFGLPGIAISQTPISRVLVDLERYSEDRLEEKSAFGQGVIYTHNTRGKRIRRELSAQERKQLLDSYYHPWHLHLELNIQQQLERWGYCLLLDCHSFPDQAFDHEEDNGLSRPDICLGINRQNTPRWLIDYCASQFRSRGYSVDIDFPYQGCLVPDRYLCDARVPAIMIEINRRLYIESYTGSECSTGKPPNKLTGFDTVKNDIWSTILALTAVTACKVLVPS